MRGGDPHAIKLGKLVSHGSEGYCRGLRLSDKCEDVPVWGIVEARTITSCPRLTSLRMMHFLIFLTQPKEDKRKETGSLNCQRSAGLSSNHDTS